ncbi:MAG: TolC family protein [Planctomycetes bacterium]|nr:TolC family protein [Planctomycetota bacterium]
MKIISNALPCFLAVAFSLISGGAAAETGNEKPASPASALSLEWVLSEVLSKNPSLLAARANREAMAARAPQARAWEDPRVGVDIERHGTTRFDTFTDIEWMVAQTLPLSGKNRQRARAASAEAEAALVGLRRREFDLIARARAAYYRYANAFAQLELNRKYETLLNQIVELCRDKHRTGKRTEADALAAESGVARLLEARLDIERQISFMNSERAVIYGQLLAQAANLNDIVELQALTARELLLAGQIEEAIQAFSQLEQLIKQNPTVMDVRNNGEGSERFRSS